MGQRNHKDIPDRTVTDHKYSPDKSLSDMEDGYDITASSHRDGSDDVRSGLKERLDKIERDWAAVDKEKDNAVYRSLTIELYTQLLSLEGKRYFQRIYQKCGAQSSYVGKELEDYLSEIWLETCRLYDSKEGHLFGFISNRLKSRMIDDIRKAGGINGLPRDREKRDSVTIESSDVTDQDEKEWSAVNNIDKAVADGYEVGSGGEFDKNLVMDAQLLELASQIQHFRERHKGKQSTEQNHFYYRVFYSTDIINYLKCTQNTEVFWHERDTMSAMDFPFTNYCTDREDQYPSSEALGAVPIAKKKLAKKGETLPQDKVTDENWQELLDVPLQNEVVRGYLERERSITVTSERISQRMKGYRKDMYIRLKEKDLSYADIWGVR